jgi:hypothetical protein
MRHVGKGHQGLPLRAVRRNLRAVARVYGEMCQLVSQHIAKLASRPPRAVLTECDDLMLGERASEASHIPAIDGDAEPSRVRQWVSKRLPKRR